MVLTDIDADAGAAVLLPEGEASGARLVAEITQILDESGRRQHMAEASAALSSKDAAQRVAQILLEAVGGPQK